MTGTTASMETIALELLATVNGGVEVEIGPTGLNVKQSNYESSINNTIRTTNENIPDSRPWYQFWGKDENADKRLKAIQDGMKECRTVPQG